MSKMSELDFLVQELKKCGESLVNIADELTGIFSETGEKKEEAPAEPAKEYTFTEVRHSWRRSPGPGIRRDQEDP